jgi:hypothetical protein
VMKLETGLILNFKTEVMKHGIKRVRLSPSVPQCLRGS